MSKLHILKHYLHYKNKKYKTRQELEQYQEKKIIEHLKFITHHSKYYADYKNKKLEDFPVINKKLMMDNFDQMNTVGINKNEALAFAIDSEKKREFQGKLKNITIGLSSGTSDTRGVFLVSDKEKNQWAGYILAKVLDQSILKKQKIAFFMRANSNLYEAVKSKTIKFSFFDIYRPIEENIEKLKAYKPDILVGQPSVLKSICESIENKALKLSLTRVVSIAEVLESQDENYIKRVLKQDVIHQVYQCTEGCLATTCEYGTIHLNEDVVHIEKQYLDDKRFIPIITDFSRKAQPIIRYRLNDVLVEKKQPCKCNSVFVALEKIEGREDDVFSFYDENNTEVQVFPDFIRRCILFAGDIDNYRVVQQENGEISIYIDEGEEIKEKITAEWIQLAKDMQFILPDITFYNYTYDPKVKLKRVESLRHKQIQKANDEF